MSGKAIAGYLALAFVIWWVIQSPAGAEQVVHNIGTFLSAVAAGVTRFFGNI